MQTKFLSVLCALICTVCAYAAGGTQQASLQEKTEKGVFVQHEMKKAEKRFLNSYQKEFGSKGYAVVFAQRQASDSPLTVQSVSLQLFITPNAAQACWQEMKNAGFVNIRTEPVPAEPRARREYVRKGGSLFEEPVGELRVSGVHSGTKTQGTRAVSFHLFGVTNGVLARVLFPGDLTEAYLSFIKKPESLASYAQAVYCPSIPAEARTRLLNNLSAEDRPFLKIQ